MSIGRGCSTERTGGGDSSLRRFVAPCAHGESQMGSQRPAMEDKHAPAASSVTRSLVHVGRSCSAGPTPVPVPEIPPVA